MDTDKVIKFAGEAGFGGNQRNTLLVKLLAFAHRVERAEREACAQVALDAGLCSCGKAHIKVDAAMVAEAIRMRSNVEVSGLERLHRAASRERSERG